jgi:hypothetical protein
LKRASDLIAPEVPKQNEPVNVIKEEPPQVRAQPAKALQSKPEKKPIQTVAPKSPMRMKRNFEKPLSREIISARIYPEVRQALKEHGVPLSDLVNTLLLEYVRKEGWL